ncbi:hypothetical protein SKAU_G00317600 [Synaphobranchus kaupii]|uniref:Uncharacterized protein n=1 Tax=Synaphobranchus kaupii TaxID=118154 RepID=A0A9Q1ESY3_SYNKA|nr:hypothetical protein SKAU_G00317600 [Synaphobranchus kaupii]
MSLGAQGESWRSLPVICQSLCGGILISKHTLGQERGAVGLPAGRVLKPGATAGWGRGGQSRAAPPGGRRARAAGPRVAPFRMRNDKITGAVYQNARVRGQPSIPIRGALRKASQAEEDSPNRSF